MDNILPRLGKRDIFWLLLLTATYFILTTANLTRLPIFVDEALYLRWAQIAWHDASWRFISLTDGKQPLFMWLAIPLMKVIADPLYAGRLLSVISGFITALGMWYAGWLLTRDKRVGYLAFILGALSPFLFFYNRFAVVEALLTAAGVWTFNLSYLMVTTLRLDMALLLGIASGLGLLIKSPARFYFLMIPVSALLLLGKKLAWGKLGKFTLLTGISWIIAEALNNIQRLSPWMHMISQKNEFFIVPTNQIFAEPARLWNNFLDLFRWHAAYTTLPILLLGLVGLLLLIRKDWRKGLLLTAWLGLPLMGEVAIARLFSPRYMVFPTPFLLLAAAYLLSLLKPRVVQVTIVLLLILPMWLNFRLITSPETYPFVSTDEGYVNGWSAGNGVKQISTYLEDQAKVAPSPVMVGTEGTFGILPHGIELYTNGTANLEIKGYYPLNQIPPQELIEKSTEGPTYFVLNNTEIDGVPPHLELVGEYKKAKDTWMKLFRVVP